MLLWKLLGCEGRKERETCEKHNRGLFGMAGSGNLLETVLGKVRQHE